MVTPSNAFHLLLSAIVVILLNNIGARVMHGDVTKDNCNYQPTELPLEQLCHL